jgi:tRNA-2-methylthio-N6-dimethylallyladenosine synthase
MNEYDSQKMRGILKKHGCIEVDDEFDADVFILNTCSVREKAAHKIYTRMGVIKKQFGPNKIVGLCGCVASQEGRALFKKIPNLNFIIGTRSIHLIFEAINHAKEGEKYINVEDNAESLNIAPENIDRGRKVKAFISIMEGCDNFCTYCIVPFTRGRERSKPINAILDEIKYSVENEGVIEVELLGQNVNSYNYNGIDFKTLLQEVDKIQGIKRIRFLTSHPKDFNEGLVKVIKNSEKICNYIHLPIQSGSNEVLKRMGRRYTKEEYLEKIDMLKSYIPNVVISSDFIVAFPGETEKDFLETMEVIHKVQYDNVFSFKYSKRPKTAALKFEKYAVEQSIAEKRLFVLQKAQENIQQIKHNKLLGKEMEVLVEQVSKKDLTRLTGRTEGNHVVNFKSGRGEQLIGSIVKVKITGATLASLTGELL